MNKVKKFVNLSLLIVAAAVVASCGMNSKTYVYLQGSAETYAVPQEIAESFELKIQPDDELAISVSSKNPELIEPFNNVVLIGGGMDPMRGSASSTVATVSRVAYFMVSKDGTIDFPILGKVNAAGKTCQQLGDELQNIFVSENHILDAGVNVRIENFKVSIMGDVKSPGTKSFSTERVSILDALAAAGDLASTAKRSPILVMREQDGQRVAYEVDLTSPESVYTSPAYYLQQNDVVYVQPNKSSRIRSSTGYLFLSIGSTVISLLVSITSLIISLND